MSEERTRGFTWFDPIGSDDVTLAIEMAKAMASVMRNPVVMIEHDYKKVGTIERATTRVTITERHPWLVLR